MTARKLTKNQILWIANKAKSLLSDSTEFKHSVGGFGISSDYAYNNGKQIQFMAFGFVRTIERLNYANGDKILVVGLSNLHGNFGVNIANGQSVGWNYNLI